MKKYEFVLSLECSWYLFSVFRLYHFKVGTFDNEFLTSLIVDGFRSQGCPYPDLSSIAKIKKINVIYDSLEVLIILDFKFIFT